MAGKDPRTTEVGEIGSVSLPPNTLINDELRRIAIKMRVILVGKTGSGKSSTGNTLLEGTPFNTEAGGTSCTRNCSFAKGHVQGRRILIVDTPGLFDSHLSEEETHVELIKCIGISAPGPHVFLLIIPANTRITPEERSTLDLLRLTFGESMVDHTLVVFTNSDDLKRKFLSEEKFIKSLPEKVREFIELCKGGYMFLNNNASWEEKKRKVEAMLSKFEYIIDQNGSKCYSNNEFKKATRVIITNRKRGNPNANPTQLGSSEEEPNISSSSKEEANEEDECNDDDRQEIADGGTLYQALLGILKQFWNDVCRFFGF